MGYDITTHFRFASKLDGRPRVKSGDVIDQSQMPIIRLQYAPTATLSRISHGWRNRKDKGYLLDLLNGEWLNRPSTDDEDEVPAEANTQRKEIVRLTVQDTENILLIYLTMQDEQPPEDYLATLQYALQRGIETTYQVEESELASERLGRDEYRGILLWEAAEGGVGVLRRLVEERDAISQVARAALERLHYDPDTLEDLEPDCVQACYECLLSYRNQRDHKVLNRHMVKEFLAQLLNSSTFERSEERNYEEHYEWLRSLTDSRSDLERKFIDQVYRTRRRLPDEAQKQLGDYASIPDFFYESAICVFCDGSVHDEPTQMEHDRRVRAELESRGYRIIVIRYDQDLEGQLLADADVFGPGKD
jgi:very-short-patch-repair endonuclease